MRRRGFCVGGKTMFSNLNDDMLRNLNDDLIDKVKSGKNPPAFSLTAIFWGEFQRQMPLDQSRRKQYWKKCCRTAHQIAPHGIFLYSHLLSEYRAATNGDLTLLQQLLGYIEEDYNKGDEGSLEALLQLANAPYQLGDRYTLDNKKVFYTQTEHEQLFIEGYCREATGNPISSDMIGMVSRVYLELSNLKLDEEQKERDEDSKDSTCVSCCAIL